MGTKNEWIKVSDKKPPYKEIVLCFIDSSGVDKKKNNVEDSVGCGYLTKEFKGFEEHWAVFHHPLYTYFGAMLDKSIWGEVTHWMPLPEKPDYGKI